MKREIIFITGTDTGVGKTVLTVLLAKFLRERGGNAAALKPICSGGRADARKIFAVMDGVLSLDEINPWHFRAPIAPLLAAWRENKKVKLEQVLAHIRSTQKRFEILLVEGAGGLLSPLGEDFDSRDLILALHATPIIVAQNKIGAVNQILLTLEALPENSRAKARVVLMSPRKPDAATESNSKLLAQFFAGKRIFTLPWPGEKFSVPEVLKNPRMRRTLRELANQ
ncbi:MAG TPA: dethiobiotin synthase [Dongiaceae bacterium]|jgi:dethiobiotin synthetase|nr:dethiobiotin synthase [Dongiaceae bacterium]